VAERLQLLNARGFTLAELMAAAAVAGLLAVLVAPTLLGYVRTSALQAVARELAAAINLGRQIAITQNTTVCVEAVGASLRLRRGGCGGAVWTGPGTDAGGAIRISDPGSFVISATANVVFSDLGAATPAGTYTVTNQVNGATRAVVVAATGRISVR
jgi:prepilin-type N-terminal cleavage/methylation domain-containing protein